MEIEVFCPFCKDGLMLREELWSLCNCGTWLRVTVEVEARTHGPGEGKKDSTQIMGNA